MKRQRRQSARWRDQQAALVLDQRLDRPEQRAVELMGERQIEQTGFSGSLGQTGEIEPAPERGDLLRERFRTERQRLPVKTIARDGKDKAFLFGDREQHHRLVAGEQRLNLLCLHRQRIRQRGIIREFLGEGLLQGRALAGNGDQPRLGPRLSGGIALRSIL